MEPNGLNLNPFNNNNQIYYLIIKLIIYIFNF